MARVRAPWRKRWLAGAKCWQRSSLAQARGLHREGAGVSGDGWPGGVRIPVLSIVFLDTEGIKRSVRCLMFNLRPTPTPSAAWSDPNVTCGCWVLAVLADRAWPCLPLTRRPARCGRCGLLVILVHAIIPAPDWLFG